MESGSASEPEVGLRERKAASTRLALAEALSERIRTRLLSDVTVDEVAASAGVSRMTFFNYFPTKEHALEHLFRVWLFREQCARRELGLRGAAAILHLFDTFGGLVAEAPSRARQIMGWFAVRPFDRPDMELGRADRALLSPTRAHEPLRMGREVLPELVAEARRLDGARAAGSDYELAHMLGVLLFGGAMVGHSKPDQDWRALYRHHATRALALDTAPRPAKAPAKKGTRAARKTPAKKTVREGRQR